MIYCNPSMKRISPFIIILTIVSTLATSISPLFAGRAEAVGTINNIIPSSTSVALLQCANQNGAVTDALENVFDGLKDSLSGAGSSNNTSGGIAGDGSEVTKIGNATGGSLHEVGHVTGSTGGGDGDPYGSGKVEAGVSFHIEEQIRLQQEQIAQAKNSNCLKSLGMAALHDLLAASTQDIVNWINTGFEGDPLFIQDPGQFFKNIQDQEVYTFVAELNDPAKYPFGAEIGQSIGAMYECRKYTSINGNCFEQTAVFTLATDIGENWQDFYSDFNVGGWGGWLSATQNPANNPIDFDFAASREIQGRIEAQQNQLKTELIQNGGFLSLRKCILYKDGSTAETELGGDLVSGDGGSTYDASTFDYEYSYFGEIDNCAQYAVTTPGSVIADQLNIHLGASAEAVAMGDEINTSIASIFDALTNQLIDQGLASLSEGQTVVTQQTGGYGSNYISTNSVGASWYADPYAPADLYTLLRCISPIDGTAIPDCKTEIATTEEYLAALYAARDYLNTQLLPRMYLLDKHMPEPDIGWQDRMEEELQEKTGEINALNSFSDINLKFIGPGLGVTAAVVAAIPGVGAVADAIIFAGAALASFVITLIANSDENVTGGKAMAVAVLNQRYQNELKRIQWDIDNNNLTSAPAARLQRDKIPGYQTTLDTYVKTITEQAQVLAILKQIEAKLPTEPTTAETSDTETMASLRTMYSGIAGKIASQSSIDGVLNNNTLFETDLSLTEDADADIVAELGQVPWGGLDYTVPDNLVHYLGEASLIADISYAIGHCTLAKKDQDGYCPVDEAGSPVNYDYDGGQLQNYHPDLDDFYLVDYEAYAFGKAKGVATTNAAGVAYTDTELMEHAHTTADFLRLYPFGFVTSTPRQNPYSIFYPFPMPPLSKSPWEYEKLYQHGSTKDDPNPCLALKPFSLPYGTCAGSDPLLVYTRLNPTAANTFDHIDSDDKSIDKEIYLNYFIDAYNDPSYGY